MAFTSERSTSLPEPALQSQHSVVFAADQGKPAALTSPAQPLHAPNVRSGLAGGCNAISPAVRTLQPAVIFEFARLALGMSSMPRPALGGGVAGDQP
jgi:hypothetical protein